MDTKLSYNNILNIHKLNTIDNNKSETDDQSDGIEYTKYIIKLDSLETKLKIFKNKNKLFDTTIFISQQLTFNTHTIFYKTIQLRKAGQINKTWIYKDIVYINTNKEDFKSIISINNLSFYSFYFILFNSDLYISGLFSIAFFLNIIYISIVLFNLFF